MKQWVCVYAMITEIGAEEYVKVGIANDVKRRWGELQTGCPTPLSVLATFRCYGREVAAAAEADIHKYLQRFCLEQRGEWFLFAPVPLNAYIPGYERDPEDPFELPEIFTSATEFFINVFEDYECEYGD